MNGSPKSIVDRFSQLTVGVFSNHMLCVYGRDDIQLNWYLTEYRSMRGHHYARYEWTVILSRMLGQRLKRTCEKDLVSSIMRLKRRENSLLPLISFEGGTR